MASNKVALVIDNGASMVKAGFAGDDSPRAVFPPIVGSPREQSTMVGADQKDCYVGDEAFVKRDVLYPKSPVPMERGVVRDWEGMEKVWHHTFYNELRIAPEEHAALLTETPFNPRPNREKTIQIMFEKFRSPEVFLANPAVLSLYASGSLSGVVLDCGEGLSHAVPVDNGCAVREGIMQLKLAGQDLTCYMMRLLNERGYKLATRKDREAARDVKEKLSCVAQDFSQEAQAPSSSSSGREKSYDLPDGRTITIDAERFRCPEALFQPALLGVESEGIHKMVHQSVLKCDAGIHNSLFSTVVLSGGSTLFPGMAERMQKEMAALAPGAADTIRIDDSPTRLYSAWIGGCILASMDSFQWVTRQQYEESGAALVHEKCG